MNTTTETLTPTVEVTMRLSDPATIRHQAGVIYADVPEILLPPQETTTLSYQCALPFDMNFVMALPHMHRHGTQFSSTIDGAPYVETAQWDGPENALFSPPHFAPAGATFEVTCTYYNFETFPVIAGPSAITDEMRNISNEFYPLPEGHVQSFRCE